MDLHEIAKVDPEVADHMAREIERQRTTIDLCASANRASRAVLSASGSIFSDKPSEGYADRRYHGGCKNIDAIEKLGMERAKHIFNCEHANLQPHSGTNANLAIFFGFLEPGETVLSMSLAHGGHLSHGFSANLTGKFYRTVSYHTNKDTELIDFEEVESQAVQEKPKLIIAGATSYPRQIDFKRFKEIADKVGAYLLADIAHIGGLVAAGEHPSPFPWCDFSVVTNYKTLPGSRGGMILCKKEHAARVDKALFPGIQGGMIASLTTAKTVSLKECLMPRFKEFQNNIVNNAKALAEALKQRGYRLVTGGTDVHMLIIDLNNRGITGVDAQRALEQSGITVDKNLIPNDARSSMVTSGIRIGTQCVTAQGMREFEMAMVAEFIDETLKNINNERAYAATQKRVVELCSCHKLDR